MPRPVTEKDVRDAAQERWRVYDAYGCESPQGVAALRRETELRAAYFAARPELLNIAVSPTGLERSTGSLGQPYFAELG